MSFDPITLSTIATIASTAGAAVSAVGAMQANMYQAAVAERNKRIFEENARAEIEQSQREQADWGVSAKGQLGDLAAELAATGATAGGSAGLRYTGAGQLARRDAQRIAEEGKVRADGQYQAAADAASQAGQARSAAGFALFEGAGSALSSYISGSTQTRRIRGLIR